MSKKRPLDDITGENNNDSKKSNIPVKIVVVYNPKYPGNTGTILRLSYQMGYKMIIVSDSIGGKFLKDMNRAAMQNKLKTTPPTIVSSLTEDVLDNTLPWYALDIPSDYHGNTPLCDIYKYSPAESHVVIVGAEDTGVPHDILDKCDVVLKIPPACHITSHCSMNVSCALSMAIGAINAKLCQ